MGSNENQNGLKGYDYELVMELDCEPRAEASIQLEYTKHLQDDKSLCSVCMSDETKQGEQWDIYQRKCGHIAHTRCLRRWFSMRECVSSPICGDIPEIQRNRVRSDCNKFGHSVMMDRCDKRRKVLDDLRYELIALKV